MAKINHEEYEKIKLLPDYDWNWIAREKTGKILSFANKPTKTDEVWKDKQTRLWFNYKDSQLFQFIKWEDEEPYNITELIEEYERYEIGNTLEESEEAEVKKDIEWLKEEIRRRDKGYIYKDDLMDIINKVDEPEALSQEWIDEHARAVAYDGMPDETEIVYVDELQNLLAPRQEEVDRAYKDGYEKGKQHTFYKGYLEGITDKGSEPETIADVVTTFWKSYKRLKEVMSMEVEEMEENDND